MFRSHTTQIIVLKKERFGEFHKSLSMLTRDLGVLTATAYGAYKMKSNLRAATEPFVYATAYLYINPVKRTYKLTDAEVLETFDAIRQSLPRFYAASLWAEVLLRSLAGGETSATVFELLLAALRALQAVTEDGVIYVSLQFLWRFLGAAGYQPAVDSCGQCGRSVDASTPMYYSSESPQPRCRACARPADRILPPGGRRYLQGTSSYPFERAVAVRMDDQPLAALREYILSLVRSVLEVDLKSLKGSTEVVP